MNAAGRDERHLELKVGAMIIVALIMLVTFVLILSDWSFQDRVQTDVYFHNPGGLTAGAAVKVAGRKVGVIKEMTYLGQNGPMHPLTKRTSLVRTKVEVNQEVFDSLRQDVKFYITTKGVLGDPFIEIDPGEGTQKLNTKMKVFGVDPPRLDLFLADAAELVTGLNALLSTNQQNIEKLLGGSAKIIGTLADFMDGDAGFPERAKIGKFIDSLEELTEETQKLVIGARTKYVDDPSLGNTINNMESLSYKLNKEIGPLIKDIKRALAVVDKLGDTLGEEEQKSIKDALTRLDDITLKADRTLGKVEKTVDKMNRGEGTVGQLLADEEIYDDLKELIRDLKQHPWKLIWED